MNKTNNTISRKHHLKCSKKEHVDDRKKKNELEDRVATMYEVAEVCKFSSIRLNERNSQIWSDTWPPFLWCMIEQTIVTVSDIYLHLINFDEEKNNKIGAYTHL